MKTTAWFAVLALTAGSSTSNAQDVFTSAQRAEIARIVAAERETIRRDVLREVCDEFAGEPVPPSCQAVPSSAHVVTYARQRTHSPTSSPRTLPFNATRYFGRVANATADTDIDGGANRAEFAASNGSSKATIRLSHVISADSNDPGVRTFATTSAALSTPLDKDGPTDLFDIDGFANATSIELRHSKLKVFGVTNRWNEGDKGDEPSEAMTALYEKAGLDMETHYDLNLVKQALAEKGQLFLYPEFEALYWAPRAWRLAYGGSLTVGMEDFEYVPVGTTNKADEGTVPWSVGIFAGFMPPGRGDLYFGGGVEFQNAYKAAKTRTVCPSTTTGPVFECLTGAYGAPEEVEKHLAYVEVRRAFPGFSALAKLTHDFNNHDTAIDVPLFLFNNLDANSSSGFRIGWNTEDDFIFGVFVGTAFDLGANPTP